jgi:hypothetical protein
MLASAPPAFPPETAEKTRSEEATRCIGSIDYALEPEAIGRQLNSIGAMR